MARPVFHLLAEIRPDRVDAPKPSATRCTASAQAHAFNEAVFVELVEMRPSQGESLECAGRIAKLSIARR
jgi:hypothetical protein